MLGAVPNGGLLMSDPIRMADFTIDLPMYTEIGIEATAWGFVKVGGSVRTSVYMTGWIGFSPVDAMYGVWAGVDLGKIRVEWRHFCYHPVSPYTTWFGDAIVPNYEGGYDEVRIVIGTPP